MIYFKFSYGIKIMKNLKHLGHLTEIQIICFHAQIKTSNQNFIEEYLQGKYIEL